MLCNLVIILLVGSSALTWGDIGSLLAAGVDFIFPLDPVKAFKDSLYTYDTYTENIFLQQIPMLFPYKAFIATLGLTGIPLYLVQKMLFVFILTLPGLSMLYFAGGIPQNRGLPETQLISSLLYMLNPYVIALWRGGSQFQLFAYAILPLILGLIDSISSRPDLRLLGCTKIALASLLMGTAASCSL